MKLVKILTAAAVLTCASLPSIALAKDVTVFEEKVSGITWTTKIKNVEKGPLATLLLRKDNSKTVCKEQAVALTDFAECSAKAAGSAYAQQALNEIKKVIPGL